LIYITIPVHNEEETVGVLLWKIRKTMADFGRDFEILVLDDASTDETPQVLERYSKVVPLTVVRSEQRLGHGRATERLLRQAARQTSYPKRDVAVTLQGDFTEERGRPRTPSGMWLSRSRGTSPRIPRPSSQW